MQVHFSYQHGTRNPQVDKIIDTHVHKLDQLLVRFAPDLIHLHGVVEFGTDNGGPLCSLNLWLPTAQLHARERGRDLAIALRTSFNHLREQVKKHKQVLRREGEWKRQRYRSQKEATKLQAGELRVQDRQQLRDYLDQVLPQLERFIARELRYQQAGGLLRAAVQKEEILDEVVARVLENHKAFAAGSPPYHLLLQDAIRVLNGQAAEATTLHLERASRRPAGRVSPSERTEEKPDPADLCLALLPPKKRQVYVLHVLEGFGFEEAGQVLGQLASEVEETFLEVSRQVSATLRASRPKESDK